MTRTYFVEFTFDFWEILYTEAGVKEGGYEKVFHTGRGSNESRSAATADLLHMIASGQLPAGKVTG